MPTSIRSSAKEFKNTELGEIPENWKVRKLSEFCDILMGQSPPSSTYNFNINGLPFFQGRKDFGTKYPKKSMWCFDPTRIANEGNVLLSVRAPVGDVNVAVEKCCIGRGLSALSMKNGNKEFLYYLLLHNQQRLKQIFESEGTVFGCVTKCGLRDFEVTLPAKDDEQRAIAKILSDLDEKIELNYQMNKILESIAQAIFKRWFVDFEFPDKNGKTYKSSGGKMINSELGEIPEGWRAGRLSDILKLQIGGDWGEDDNFEDAIQVMSLRGTDLEQLKSCGYAPDAPVRWIKKDSLEKRHIGDCDILIGGSGLGPIGRSIYCSSETNSLYQYPVTYSNFCKRLSSEIPAYAIYAECILENMYRSEEMKQYFTGTSIPNLDTNSLLNYEIVIPSKTTITAFYQIIKNKYARRYSKENTVLSQIRDSLLPRLMSGKMRVLLEERG